MTTYYIDPAAATNGTGTTASPFNTWTGVPAAAGDVYKQKRGTTWAGAFPSLANGTSGNVTTVTAYANADGSDNAALARPVIDIGDRMMPGTLGSPKTFLKFSQIDLRCTRATNASDTPIMWMGDDLEISDCNITSNLTALYGEGRSRIKILRNAIRAATASTTTHAINAIVIGGSTAPTGIVIDGNTITVGDGGVTGAHAIKVSCTVPITDIQITNNTIRTASGAMTTHIDKAGIFVANGSGTDLRGPSGTTAATIVIAGNDVQGMVDGVFTSAVSGAWVHHNTLNENASFGLHITGSASVPASGNIIEWNTCSRNGRNASPWYGRGIELSGAGQLHACTSNIVRFNDCSYNNNWGGPADNGTEGVGIGLDDATSFCLVYGNFCYRNEGQGIQLYGGSSPPADTGGNLVTGNQFIENGTTSIWNRRSGGTFKTAGACNISLGNTVGSRTVIAYNTIVGSFGGLRESVECTNVSKYGNVFMGQTSYGIADNATTGISNNIYKPGIPKNIGTLALDANNSPAPALLSNGATGDLTTDPMLDARYLPITGSPLLSRSIPWAPVAYPGNA